MALSSFYALARVISGNIQLGYGACSIWNEAESVLRGRGFTLDDVKLTLACTPMKEMLQRQFGLTFTATAIDKELITDSDNYACTFTQSWQVDFRTFLRTTNEMSGC